MDERTMFELLEIYDAAKGEYTTSAIRVSMRIVPKTTSLGSFEVGSTTDTEQEFEVTYLKLFVDGVEVVEIDKFNYIARFNGVDALEKVRRDLGL
jgi:P2 family phage contractile tail tube protein